MKTIISIILLLFFVVGFAQNTDNTYLSHDHNYGSAYSYAVTEFIIHSDSTYTRKDYDLSSKKEWKDYKQYTPEISIGKIHTKGKFQILTEYHNGNKTDFFWAAKIKERKLIFFFPNRRGIMKRTAVYKRIDKKI